MVKKKYYRTEEFIKIQNEWYEKLSKAGFSDLEWLDKNTGLGQSTPFLKGNERKFKHLDASELSQTSEYFVQASQFAQLHKFSTKLHKYIWQLFAEGVSYRKMIPRIRSRRFKYVPSIFWISVELNKLKRDFWLWQLSQPDEPETLEQFLCDNRGVDDV